MEGSGRSGRMEEIRRGKQQVGQSSTNKAKNVLYICDNYYYSHIQFNYMLVYSRSEGGEPMETKDFKINFEINYVPINKDRLNFQSLRLGQGIKQAFDNFKGTKEYFVVGIYEEFYFPKPNDWINSNGIRLIREDRFHENLSKHDDENDEIKELFENSSSYFNKLFWAEEIKSKCNKPSNLIDLFNNIKYHFVNQHFLGNFKDYPINPINNNFGYIGGITFESKGILTKQVKTKKDENESSCVVLVTFGTAILPFRRHQQYRNAMFTVFEHFGNCIFKVRIRTDKISYNNIEITNEKLPQQDILAKENTKLLISHCGQNSLNEV
uniref:glucuronosyltransferase n=1 Tax=Meloidogyne hapla TaxID=6305 RepID=A0A1I8BXN3_MELHA